MSIEQNDDNVVIPSSPADRQKLKAMITEITLCMQKKKDQSDAIKDIVATVSKDFNIPKKHITKMAKVWFNRDYTKVQAEQADFETLYEAILESPKKDEE